MYPDTDIAEYHHLPYDAIVMGHTHRPFVRRSGGKWFVNTGSIGLPRDQGNLSSFAVYDTARHQFDIVRVGFEVADVIAAYGCQVAESVRNCLQRSGGKG